MEITGTKGTIVLVEDSLQTWEFAEMTEEDETILKKYGSLASSSGVADPAAISFQNHAKNISAFVEEIEKQMEFEINGKEARKAVALITDIYESAKSGKMI